jgi:hypothetical protein
MRFITIASAAALAPALVAATYHADLKQNLGTARVHNRCDYPLYLWSVKKDQGCEEGNMKVLQKGESYSEKYRDDQDHIGVSIKISKTNRCKGLIAAGEEIDITQLEYHINHDNPDFMFNFLDVSFVDCLGKNCPGRNKFYLKSGNNGDARLATAGADKAICPILKCSSEEECATMAYILPDDVQTKSCEPAADMDFYVCADSPDDYEESEPEPAPSSSDEEEKPEPTSTNEEPTYAEADVEAAAITPAPVEAPFKEKKIKTEVVYVTKYEYVNAKRHAHGHQHKHFRA